MAEACSIVLVSINARYAHAGYAVRTLHANLGDLRGQTATLECDLTALPLELAEAVVERGARITSFSVYLWNVETVLRTLSILRRVAPGVLLTVGGPEVTQETAARFDGLADCIMIGEGETALRTWCREALSGNIRRGVIIAEPEDVAALVLPDAYYTDEDIARRIVYTESSRGCPFGCAYCTSASTPLRLFPRDPLFASWERLLARGVRTFKFLDRSFNVVDEHACAVMDFFLSRRERINLHFEVHPGVLSAGFKERLERAPKGMFHLEAGVQTLNASVAQRIGRSEDVENVLANTAYLCSLPSADVHVDLIFGLPGETAESFAAGFDLLVKRCRPTELQVNQLKCLPGTALSQARGGQDGRPLYSESPPYELLASDAMSFEDLVCLRRFARCWELVYNRGNFADEAAQLLDGAESPYAVFQALADRVYEAHGKLYALSRAELAEALRGMIAERRS